MVTIWPTKPHLRCSCSNRRHLWQPNSSSSSSKLSRLSAPWAMLGLHQEVANRLSLEGRCRAAPVLSKSKCNSYIHPAHFNSRSLLPATLVAPVCLWTCKREANHSANTCCSRWSNQILRPRVAPTQTLNNSNKPFNSRTIRKLPTRSL